MELPSSKIKKMSYISGNETFLYFREQSFGAQNVKRAHILSSSFKNKRMTSK